MNLLRYTATVFLIIVITMSGVPHFLAEDTSRDGMLDLDDVILQVQALANSADDSSASFDSSFEKMMNTLASVAGLKTLINPGKESGTTKQQANLVISPDKICNSISFHLPLLLTVTQKYVEPPVIHAPGFRDPAVPPPRLS